MKSDDAREFFLKKKVLFATNGDYGKDSPLELSLSTYRDVADKNIIVLESEHGKFYGKNAFESIFDYGIANGYDYVIYIDADCFITNIGNLVKLFSKFEQERDSIVGGCADGGIICHRNSNPYCINPFIMFVRLSEYSEFKKSNRIGFSKNLVTDRTKFNLDRTIDAYNSYKIRNIYRYAVPHALLISQPHNRFENFYGCSQNPWTKDEDNLTAEPYYRLFLPMHDGKRSFFYFFGRDYPKTDVDLSGISTAVYSDSDISSDSNLVCLHSWFERMCDNDYSYGDFKDYQVKRIFSIGKFAASLRDRERAENPNF